MQATYDVGTIHTIVNTTPVLHISFSPDPADPYPAVLPMIGAMGSFEYPSADIDEPMDCYIHGYVSSRIMNVSRKSPEGMPVCIVATKVDGLVLSLTPYSHNYNYRSAILYGRAKPVETVEEKLFAMQLITNKVLTDRWAHSRTPPDPAELQSTTILKVTIDGGSGKISAGSPHDDQKELAREGSDKIWTGVVPLCESFGDPIPCPTNKVERVPEHITTYISQTNERNREYAERVAHLP